MIYHFVVKNIVIIQIVSKIEKKKLSRILRSKKFFIDKKIASLNK